MSAHIPAPDHPHRDLALQGVYNARDLGGYATRDGRRTRWNQVYRSASLQAATSADVSRLIQRGLRVVCDLRSGFERSAAPNAWIASTAIESWGRPTADSAGDSRQLLAKCGVSAEATRAVMIDAYRRIPFELRTAYSQLFRRLAEGQLPLLFHCSAGKDRSGVAAALLLDVLGVPREAVLADYLLTNRAFELIRAAFLADSRHGTAAHDATQAWLPMLHADAQYLDAMFASVEQRRGSVAQYLEADLGLGTGELAALARRLLE